MQIVHHSVRIDELPPRRIVEELDRYVIGQDDAKRAVALAIRNRWRRRRLDAEIAGEVTPRNIVMIGPTGVGKTEIARRLADMIDAPFVKVEASKFTEVGYQGRDVESMIRDLVKQSVAQVRRAETEQVMPRAEEHAEERILDLLLPAPDRPADPHDDGDDEPERRTRTREKLRKQLRDGNLDDRPVEVQVRQAAPVAGVFGSMGGEEMGWEMQDALEKMLPGRTRTRRATVGEAKRILAQEEAEKLIDEDEIARRGLERAEQNGIVFLDEIDKIIGSNRSEGPDVSREGVQRDLLPVVEGAAVNTKHGMIRTDHILFIAAGAFHGKKPSDLIPELQGRFPIRVTLLPLTHDDFVRILTHPKNALARQYELLLGAEGVTIVFEDEALDAVAATAERVNRETDDIGARRLHTVMEKLMEEVSFEADDLAGTTVTVTESMVNDRLADLAADQDLSRYIL